MQEYDFYQKQIERIKKEIEENKQLLGTDLDTLAKQESEKLNRQMEQLKKAQKDYKESLSESTEEETGIKRTSCSLEIRGGAGGDEAKIWADDLLRMYVRFCENMGFKYEYLDDLVLKVKGKTDQLDVEGIKTMSSYEVFKYESGVHRVQRVPVTESQGRIHTSTASVAVLPEVSSKAIKIRDEDLDWQFMRSSGAGGQSVNKTSSAVRLTHKPSGIVATARSERKQAQNREIALALLRSQLWEIEEEKKMDKIDKARAAIGRNMRAEKIRTYNYPQNRVTDHRINKSWHNLEDIVDGNLNKVIEALVKID